MSPPRSASDLAILRLLPPPSPTPLTSHRMPISLPQLKLFFLFLSSTSLSLISSREPISYESRVLIPVWCVPAPLITGEECQTFDLALAARPKSLFFALRVFVRFVALVSRRRVCGAQPPAGSMCRVGLYSGYTLLLLSDPDVEPGEWSLSDGVHDSSDVSELESSEAPSEAAARPKHRARRR